MITPGAYRLCLVTDDGMAGGRPITAVVAAAVKGGVTMVQIRDKARPTRAFMADALALKGLLAPRGIPLIVNDRVDIALAIQADGVHVGQDDMPAVDARRLLGPGLTLGVTCKGSRDLAMQAGEDGADYVAFGAFFPSGTKDVTNIVTPDILAWWSEMMELPCCAIGGITADNCAPLVQAGADFLAVVGSVWGHPDGPAAGIRALDVAIRAAAGG